jgi:hypothetical protein
MDLHPYDNPLTPGRSRCGEIRTLHASDPVNRIVARP